MVDPRTLPAELLEKYRPIERLGTGVSGAVFRARQLSLDRDVVLKLVSAPDLESDLLARALLEAEVLAGLRHPNVVGLLDHGVCDGWLYLVLPDDGGRALSQIDELYPCPPARLRSLLADVLRGLTALHERDVVHRDLKPANVLLLPDGSAKLIDLGLAKELEGEEQLTLTGLILGTPYYMAPDQVAGGPTDPRDDLYSVGVIAYELLTGENPFDAGSVHKVLDHQMHTVPPAPAELTDCPSDLSAWVMTMLEKDREDRYPSAREALGALRRESSGGRGEEATLRISRGPTRRTRSRRKKAAPPRSGVPAVAALVLIGVLAGLTALGTRAPSREAPPPPTAPTRPLEELAEEFEQARADYQDFLLPGTGRGKLKAKRLFARGSGGPERLLAPRTLPLLRMAADAAAKWVKAAHAAGLLERPEGPARPALRTWERIRELFLQVPEHYQELLRPLTKAGELNLFDADRLLSLNRAREELAPLVLQQLRLFTLVLEELPAPRPLATTIFRARLLHRAGDPGADAALLEAARQMAESRLRRAFHDLSYRRVVRLVWNRSRAATMGECAELVASVEALVPRDLESRAPSGAERRAYRLLRFLRAGVAVALRCRTTPLEFPAGKILRVARRELELHADSGRRWTERGALRRLLDPDRLEGLPRLASRARPHLTEGLTAVRALLD